jgi:hypothetical protein
MDVGKISLKYMDGNEESFVCGQEVSKIKIMADRIIVIFCDEPTCRKKSCKVIITTNLQSYTLSPCDERDLMSAFG